MADGPLPDHYKALGVDDKVDSATIKAIYRKQVLKCHPDKVTDPALKEEATEKFHAIQQAYETLIDDDKRKDYDCHVKLEKLRREKAARGGAPRGERTARFEQPTSSGASFTATGASRYNYATEERRPSKSYDDDHYYETRKRDKYDTYDAYPKTSTSSRPRTEKESSSKNSKPSTSDRTRSDREKTRAKDLRSDRKFNNPESAESSADEKTRYEAEYRRRSQEDEARKQAEASRRKAEDRRSYEEREQREPYPTASRKMSVKEEEALRYQHKTRAQVQDDLSRPSPNRTSSRDQYPSEHRSSQRTSQREPSRPETVRRSSAQPKQRQSSSARREPEIVGWGEEPSRRPPGLNHSSSSPANIEIPTRGVPSRSYTDSSSARDPRRSERSPPPMFQRSSTMPVGGMPHVSSARRKDTAPARPSNLRETITPEHSSPERDAYTTGPSVQTPASKTTYYSYAPGSAGVSLRPDDYTSPSSKPRTVLREPGRHHRSPSPLGRPPMGANVQESAKYTTKATAPRPSMPRTDSSRHYSPTREDRGRTARPKLFNEIDGDSYGRGRQASYSSADVHYAPNYGPEDVRWAPRGRENDRDYASKPTLGRTATYVY